MNTSHQIQKQVLEIILPNQDNNTRISNEVKTIFNNEVLPQMEMLFDELVPSHQLLILDRLELDITAIQSEEIQTSLSDKIILALEKAIRKELNQVEEITDVPLTEENSYFKNKEDVLENAFIYFIRNGTFPNWWKERNHQVFEKYLVEINPERIKQILLPLIKIRHQRDRLLLQFSESFWVKIIALFQPQLIEVFKENHIQKKERQALIIQKLFELPKVSIENIEILLKNNNTIATKEEVGLVEGKNTAQSIYIKNAGLVLIAPFLEHFFEKLLLTENNVFINEASQQRAILLTEYLITNRTEISESDLVLNKIICGYTLEKPLPYLLEISPTEIKECESLLESIIEYWTALRQTSPKGLQSSFLQRKGRLRQSSDGWKLKVEKQTQDILINQIPWAIGVVKLAWMEEMVWVEWN